MEDFPEEKKKYERKQITVLNTATVYYSAEIAWDARTIAGAYL